MSNEEKEFDDFLRRRLDDYEAVPHQDLWAEIESSLPPKRINGRRVAGYALVLLLILGTIGGWYQYGQQEAKSSYNQSFSANKSTQKSSVKTEKKQIEFSKPIVQVESSLPKKELVQVESSLPKKEREKAAKLLEGDRILQKKDSKKAFTTAYFQPKKRSTNAVKNKIANTSLEAEKEVSLTANYGYLEDTKADYKLWLLGSYLQITNSQSFGSELQIPTSTEPVLPQIIFSSLTHQSLRWPKARLFIPDIHYSLPQLPTTPKRSSSEWWLMGGPTMTYQQLTAVAQPEIGYLITPVLLNRFSPQRLGGQVQLGVRRWKTPKLGWQFSGGYSF